MMKIANISHNVPRLFRAIVQCNTIPVFDLDEVLLEAKHRQKLYDPVDVAQGKCQPDQIGQLDLDHYRANTQRGLVMQDKSLPLIGLVHLLNEAGIVYHIATARVLCPYTLELLEEREILAGVKMGRENDQDHRRDNVLKVDRFKENFDGSEIKNMLFLDDNLANCHAIRALGAQVAQVVSPC